MGYLKRLSKNDHNFSSISEYDKYVAIFKIYIKALHTFNQLILIL